jgi:hypothetical protein
MENLDQQHLRKSEGGISQRLKRLDHIRKSQQLSIIKRRNTKAAVVRYINPDVEP